MLENYTNEHFADMQNDTDFLIALHQEVADLIAKNLGETMASLPKRIISRFSSTIRVA